MKIRQILCNVLGHVYKYDRTVSVVTKGMDGHKFPKPTKVTWNVSKCMRCGRFTSGKAHFG